MTKAKATGKMSGLKKGDKIVLRKSLNSLINYEGRTFEIVAVGPQQYSVMLDNKPDAGTFSIYHTNGAYNDEFCLATRAAQADFIKAKINKLKEQITCYQKEVEELLKFESDEDEVANKLHKILTAKGEKDIARILKELKQSNYI